MSRREKWYRRACASASVYSLFSLAALTTGNPDDWGFLSFLGFLLFLITPREASASDSCPIPQ